MTMIGRNPLNPEEIIRIPDIDWEKNVVREVVEENWGIPYSQAPDDVKIELEKRRFEEENRLRSSGPERRG